VRPIARSGQRCLQIRARLIERVPSILELFLLIGKLRLQLLHLFAGCGGAPATRLAGGGPRSRLRSVGGRLALWHLLLLGGHVVEFVGEGVDLTTHLTHCCGVIGFPQRHLANQTLLANSVTNAKAGDANQRDDQGKHPYFRTRSARL